MQEGLIKEIDNVWETNQVIQMLQLVGGDGGEFEKSFLYIKRWNYIHKNRCMYRKTSIDYCWKNSANNCVRYNFAYIHVSWWKNPITIFCTVRVILELSLTFFLFYQLFIKINAQEPLKAEDYRIRLFYECKRRRR